MNIAMLKLEAERDLQLDKSKIVQASMNSGVIISKWLGYYQQTALEIQKAKQERDKIELLLYLYYSGKANKTQIEVLGKTKPFGLKIDTKGDIDRFIRGSKEYIDTDLNVKTIEQTLKYIDEVIQALKSQNFKITNIINYLKFENGE